MRRLQLTEISKRAVFKDCRYVYAMVDRKPMSGRVSGVMPPAPPGPAVTMSVAIDNHTLIGRVSPMYVSFALDTSSNRGWFARNITDPRLIKLASVQLECFLTMLRRMSHNMHSATLSSLRLCHEHCLDRRASSKCHPTGNIKGTISSHLNLFAAPNLLYFASKYLFRLVTNLQDLPLIL